MPRLPASGASSIWGDGVVPRVRSRDRTLAGTGSTSARHKATHWLCESLIALHRYCLIVLKAADKFKDKTPAPNQLRQTGFTYL